MFSNLEDEFDAEMLDVYEQAKASGYNATQFRAMLVKGGRNTAKALLKAPREQSGFERLWMMGRLDISMEARVLKPRFMELFDEDERREARIRLERAGFDVRQCYG